MTISESIRSKDTLFINPAMKMAKGTIINQIKELNPQLSDNTSGGTVRAFQTGELVTVMFESVIVAQDVTDGFLLLVSNLPIPKTPNTLQGVQYTSSVSGSIIRTVRCGINSGGNLSIWGQTISTGACLIGTFTYIAA